MRAAIYTRISLDRESTGKGVARQLEDCKKLCSARGWEVVAVLEENDTSATKRKRPKYDQLVRMASDGKIDVIVGWAVDRITRTPREIEDLIDVSDKTGVKVATVTGDLDLTTDTGQLVARILGSVARQEVQRKAVRLRRANLQRAQQGTVSAGGIRTLGYEPGMTRIIEREADFISEGFSALLAGVSLREIARRWNTAGFRTAHDGEWDSTDVRVLLRNPRLAGYTKHRGEIVGRGKWTPIVTEDAWHAVQKVLDDPARRTTPTQARKYLLSGLAWCECGAKVQTGRTQHGRRTYRCSRQRGHLSRAAAIIDEYVTTYVIERLSRPDASDLVADAERPDVAELRDQANALRIRLADLSESLADPGIPMLETRRAIEVVRERLERVTGRMADVSKLNVLEPLLSADDLEATWGELALEQKRGVIDALMTVTLHSPGRGARTFNPDTVRIEPKR